MARRKPTLAARITCCGKSSCVFVFGIERERRALVRAWRAPQTEIDAARRDRFEHPKLLGHLERRVMRQHHARAADADALRRRGDRGHENLGRRADDVLRCCDARRPSNDCSRARHSAARARAFRVWPRPRFVLWTRSIDRGPESFMDVRSCASAQLRRETHNTIESEDVQLRDEGAFDYRMTPHENPTNWRRCWCGGVNVSYRGPFSRSVRPGHGGGARLRFGPRRPTEQRKTKVFLRYLLSFRSE